MRVPRECSRFIGLQQPRWYLSGSARAYASATCAALDPAKYRYETPPYGFTVAAMIAESTSYLVKKAWRSSFILATQAV